MCPGEAPPPADAQAVLDFWFGAPQDALFGQPRREWFLKDPAFDARVRERFGPLIDAAIAGELRPWAATPQGALALLLLLDQFTRNVHRGTPRAFAGDAQALEVARAVVERGWDRQLRPVQRWFVYLPFEHAEDPEAQRSAVALFEALAREAPGDGVEEALDYARRHLAVIERFGRFPHRNEILGRATTAEEARFLEQPGSSF
ncbi:DUF924 family protein [Caldimonas tepidiphila]|uniref:DUF924 family protein n=1 Tax=Caldimonas tepidiphila TaxID=2315841 RepID=UPI000E5BA3DE|nr:DUF924 family protein [Caldimonas tepidiphila]